MPSSAEQSADRRSRARRQVLTVLQITEATARYACSQLADGIGPVEARRTVLFVAGELETAAVALRRLAVDRLDPAQCRVMAVELVESGVSVRRAAELVGRSRRTVRGYLRPGRADASGHAARMASARSGGGTQSRFQPQGGVNG